MSITIFVEAMPRPGGSKIAFWAAKKQKMVYRDACAGNKDWRSAVVAFARDAYRGEALTGPLRVQFLFLMPRPKSHYTTRRTLRATAPAFPTGKPDTTKLIRSTEDALTDAGMWGDDAQVVTQSAKKRYCRDGQVPGCLIIIAQQEGTE